VILTVWLGILGPLDPSSVKQWQTLISRALWPASHSSVTGSAFSTSDEGRQILVIHVWKTPDAPEECQFANDNTEGQP
jgi:hypothetical protein